MRCKKEIQFCGEKLPLKITCFRFYNYLMNLKNINEESDFSFHLWSTRSVTYSISPTHRDTDLPMPCFRVKAEFFSKTWIILSLDWQLNKIFYQYILPLFYWVLLYCILWWHSIECSGLWKDSLFANECIGNWELEKTV